MFPVNIAFDSNALMKWQFGYMMYYTGQADALKLLEDFQSDSKSTKFNFYNREADFVDQFMDKIAPTTGKFMSFYTTVSSHGTYTISNPRFEEHFKTYDSNLELMKTWLKDQGYIYPTNEEVQSHLKEYTKICLLSYT